MGRMLRRVPLDFNAPLNAVWEGYLCPYRQVDCTRCGADGMTAESRRVRRTLDQPVPVLDAADVAYLVSLEDDLRPLTHTFVEGRGWVKVVPEIVPTPEGAVRFLSNRLASFHWKWRVTMGRSIRMGFPLRCPTCGGNGRVWPTAKMEAAFKAWRRTDPPTGEGYQLWEDTSAGSPQSPVFATLGGLAEWCATNATTHGSYTASAARWETMLSEGFVCATSDLPDGGTLVFM